jgi:hypothetical protein
MTITSRDQLINALGNSVQLGLIDKASISNAAANQYHSLWRATGQPGQAAIPAAAAVCTQALAGAIPFVNPTAPAASYLGAAAMLCANAAVSIELHDRLMHMGGLSGTVSPGSQTVDVDINANLATSNLDARKGASDFSEVQWWLEWFSDTGATASNATINVTYNDATSGDLTVVAVGGTVRASRMIPLNALIPAAKAGFFIRDVNTVTLSASTTAAGSFGVTASRRLATFPLLQANLVREFDWAQLGLPRVHSSACLFLIQYASTTSTGIVRGHTSVATG